MESVVLVVHLMLAIAIIVLVLLQRSEGGGLGIGGGSGGLGGLATARQAANVLTRATGFCAVAFFATSLLLAILAGNKGEGSIIEEIEKQEAQIEQSEDVVPSVPLSTE